jgi:hypothetical protein
MAATKLTPQQLAAIAQGLAPQYSATGGGEAGSSTYIPSQYTLDGQNYVGNGQGGYWGFADNPALDSGDKIAGYNGTPYTNYDAQGNPIGDGQLSGISNDSFMSTWGPFAMLAAGMAPALMGAGAAGVGGASTAGGIDSANGVLNSAVMGGGGAGAAGAGGAGALETLGGIPQVEIPAASTFPEFATTGGGGLLGSVASSLGISPSLLSLGATALGALAGSKGVKQNQTSTSSINPQVAPYVYGDGSGKGLLPGVQGLLAQQTSPQNMQGWQNVQNVAQGLLSQPVAGNGFSRFFPNR